MKKQSLLDQIRTHLEGVENYWLFFLMLVLSFILIAGVTLTGVYFYTKR